MTGSSETTLKDLERRRPEWAPWLGVVEEALGQSVDPRWDALVPPRPERPADKTPLLAGATLALEKNPVRSYVERLFAIACASGTEKMASLKPALDRPIECAALLKASLCQDGDELKKIAAAAGADPEAFQAVASLVPVPFLYACNRGWGASIPESWREGYCPVCGAWPAFAEIRGIERNRYFRCGRCAGQWQVNCLTCPYCGMTDHNELVSLVPEKEGASRVVDACKRCRGYVKSFTVLQASPGARVILDDLASVDLDVAALRHGYARPQGGGYALAVTVVDKPAAGGRFFSWRS